MYVAIYIYCVCKLVDFSWIICYYVSATVKYYFDLSL